MNTWSGRRGRRDRDEPRAGLDRRRDLPGGPGHPDVASSAGTGPRWTSRRRSSAGARCPARRWPGARDRHPGLRRRPGRRGHPADRAHPAGQPARPRGPPTRCCSAPRDQLLPRASTGPGCWTRGWRSSATSAGCALPGGAGAAQGRAAGGVHPAGGRRVLLRAAGRGRDRRLAGPLADRGLMIADALRCCA